MIFSAITFHSGVGSIESNVPNNDAYGVNICNCQINCENQYYLQWAGEFLINKNNDYFTQLLDSVANEPCNTYEQIVAYKVTVSFSKKRLQNCGKCLTVEKIQLEGSSE